MLRVAAVYSLVWLFSIGAAVAQDASDFLLQGEVKETKFRIDLNAFSDAAKTQSLQSGANQTRRIARPDMEEAKPHFDEVWKGSEAAKTDAVSAPSWWQSGVHAQKHEASVQVDYGQIESAYREAVPAHPITAFAGACGAPPTPGPIAASPEYVQMYNNWLNAYGRATQGGPPSVDGDLCLCGTMIPSEHCSRTNMPNFGTNMAGPRVPPIVGGVPPVGPALGSAGGVPGGAPRFVGSPAPSPGAGVVRAAPIARGGLFR